MPDRKTLGDICKVNGSQIACLGKWHLGQILTNGNGMSRGYFPPEEFKDINGNKVVSDLSSLHDLASLRINGLEIGTYWLAPFRFDIMSLCNQGKIVLK